MASGMTAPDELPDDIAELKAIIRAQQDQNARLEVLVAAFKKALFGSKSEKIDPAQYELELEDIEMAIAQVEAEIDADERTAPIRPPKPRQTNRGSLPKHLERVEVVIEGVTFGCRLTVMIPPVSPSPMHRDALASMQTIS